MPNDFLSSNVDGGVTEIISVSIMVMIAVKKKKRKRETISSFLMLKC